MSEGISLGWNCDSAIYAVRNNLRNIKSNGYKTCPFDEMVSNYSGIVECIKDDFKYFCDLNYLKLIEVPEDSKYFNDKEWGRFNIYNTKYKFVFNSKTNKGIYMRTNHSIFRISNRVINF